MDESCLGLTTVVVGHCRYCVNLRLPSLQNNISVAINSLSMMISIVLTRVRECIRHKYENAAVCKVKKVNKNSEHMFEIF